MVRMAGRKVEVHIVFNRNFKNVKTKFLSSSLNVAEKLVQRDAARVLFESNFKR